MSAPKAKTPWVHATPAPDRPREMGMMVLKFFIPWKVL